MLDIFINDNEIRTEPLCAKSKQKIKEMLESNELIPEKLDLTRYPDKELDGELYTAIDHEEYKKGKKRNTLNNLIKTEKENVEEMQEEANIAKKKSFKSVILGLAALSVVVLVSLAVVLLVPAVTAVVTTAMAALLAAGPWVLPLLITAGSIGISTLFMAPSLYFAREKYKYTRASDNSEELVKQLTSELERSSSVENQNPPKVINSNNPDNEGLLKNSVDSLTKQLKRALVWRQRTLEENPGADASYNAYLRYCDGLDQVDSQSDEDQTSTLRFKKLYDKLQNYSPDAINISLVNAALDALIAAKDWKAQSSQGSTSSAFFTAKTAQTVGDQDTRSFALVRDSLK